MAAPPFTDVYLETVEESKDEGKEPDEAGGMPQWQAYRNGNSRKGYWAVAGSGILTHTITNKRLAAAGYFEILSHYESLHLCD